MSCPLFQQSSIQFIRSVPAPACPPPLFISCSQMLRHALLRLPVALARVTFPRLDSVSPSADRPPPATSVQPPRGWRNITATATA